jgi:hypothetical protein
MKIVMRDPQGMGIVIKALVVFAVVMVAFGTWLILSSPRPMIGVLVLGLGLVDGLMAFVLSRRT